MGSGGAHLRDTRWSRHRNATSTAFDSRTRLENQQTRNRISLDQSLRRGDRCGDRPSRVHIQRHISIGVATQRAESLCFAGDRMHLCPAERIVVDVMLPVNQHQRAPVFEVSHRNVESMRKRVVVKVVADLAEHNEIESSVLPGIAERP